MGFSHDSFLKLPRKTRAKKLADLLRVFLLRLGSDWKSNIADYNQWVEWESQQHLIPSPFCLPIHPPYHSNLIRECYGFWRERADLGIEKDIYLEQESSDIDQPRGIQIPWGFLAHNMRSAFNVGSLFRTADCFGFEGVHLSGYSAPVSHKALKSAARGAETWIFHQSWDSPLDCIHHFKDQGYAIIALETGSSSQPIMEFQFPQRGLLILGNEELGIAPDLLDFCDNCIEIPMFGRKASLNVAQAAAIAAFSVRQLFP